MSKLSNYDKWKTSIPATQDVESDVYAMSKNELINEFCFLKNDSDAHKSLLADIVHLRGLVAERYDLDDEYIYDYYKNTRYMNEAYEQMREYIIDHRLNS